MTETDIPMTYVWKGKNVNELSRDELLEVIDYLARRYNELTSSKNIRAMALGSAEMLRRGEHVD